MNITISSSILGMYLDGGIELSTGPEASEVIGELITLSKNIGYISVEDFKTETKSSVRISNKWSNKLVSYCIAPEEKLEIIESETSVGFSFRGRKSPPSLQDEINFIMNKASNIDSKDMSTLVQFIVKQWSVS